MQGLKAKYLNLCEKYSNNSSLLSEQWKLIESNYSNSKRYYHNLAHLQQIFIELKEVKSKIEDWDSIQFSVFYHDLVYDALSSKNELKSAELAKKHLAKLNYPETKIAFIFESICATKEHNSLSRDVNYFLDADLSILGSEKDLYVSYCSNIRNEYSIYPDFIYNKGRIKVLKHFLQKSKLFQTNYFNDKYETQARKNIKIELMRLAM